ncbi:hypothetical protein DVH24_010078 [Malus domestica]|uniref:Uncharacterized protein n=1 Tax=Malus domestica TaxID=3750 RepID=A0A498JUZ4_MALDO|nr:hypothetical protein DVH24_010078 [Malus domestica]
MTSSCLDAHDAITAAARAATHGDRRPTLGESSSTEWHNMDLPKGEILVLNFQAKNYALPKFMKKMFKLKVLIVINDGFSPVELSDFELLCSLSNLKRLRLEHIGKLENLEVLRLRSCTDLEKLPGSIEKLRTNFEAYLWQKWQEFAGEKGCTVKGLLCTIRKKESNGGLDSV